MRRFAMLFLALVLTLSLAACGKKELPPPLWETDPVLSAADGCEAVLRVQFNPEFELYLDALGQVLQINCINADAEAAFADCDVVGLEVAEALEIMLTAAWEHEYLTDERTVTITPVAVADKSAVADVIAQIPQTVEQIKTNLGADFAVSVQDAVAVPNDDHGRIWKKTKVDGEITRTEYYRDGVMIGVIELLEDGSWCQIIYDRHGRRVFNESAYGGTRFEWPEAGGIVVAHDKEGVSTATIRADGAIARVCTDVYDEMVNALNVVYWEYNYGVDGKSAEELQVTPGGDKIRTTYADIDQGLISHRSEIYGDGGSYETKYEDGLAVYRSGTTGDGAVSETTFDENGFEKQTVETYPNGAVRTIWYRKFPAGTLEFFEPVCKIEYVDELGRLHQEIINEDGSGEAFGYHEDGTYFHRVNEGEQVSLKYIYVDDSADEFISIGGNLVRSVHTACDGAVSTSYYRADGTKERTETIDADGRIYQTFMREDGRTMKAGRTLRPRLQAGQAGRGRRDRHQGGTGRDPRTLRRLLRRRGGHQGRLA